MFRILFVLSLAASLRAQELPLYLTGMVRGITSDIDFSWVTHHGSPKIIINATEQLDLANNTYYIGTATMKYDSSGRCTERIEFSGTVKKLNIVEFDGSHSIVPYTRKKLLYLTNSPMPDSGYMQFYSEPSWPIKYTLDSQGRISRADMQPASSAAWERQDFVYTNDSVMVLSTRSGQPFFETTYGLDLQGRIVNIVTTNDGIVSNIISRTYSSGMVSAACYQTPSGPDCNSYQYDSNGDIITESRNSKTYSYQEYDSCGNWTKCKFEGITLFRHIEYYGTCVSSSKSAISMPVHGRTSQPIHHFNVMGQRVKLYPFFNGLRINSTESALCSPSW